MKKAVFISSILLFSIVALSFTTTNYPSPNASEVVFEHYRSDVCGYADKSYEFNILEDGNHYKRVLFTYNDNRWYAEGCAVPSYNLCYECTIDKAVKKYYQDHLKRSANSITIKW